MGGEAENSPLPLAGEGTAQLLPSSLTYSTHSTPLVSEKERRPGKPARPGRLIENKPLSPGLRASAMASCISGKGGSERGKNSVGQICPSFFAPVCRATSFFLRSAGRKSISVGADGNPPGATGKPWSVSTSTGVALRDSRQSAPSTSTYWNSACVFVCMEFQQTRLPIRIGRKHPSSAQRPQTTKIQVDLPRLNRDSQRWNLFASSC